MAENFETVKWQGNAGIEQAHVLRDEILEAFKKTTKIRLDISEVEDIDITGIQIIIAARREAESTGKSFHITGKIPKAIEEFITASAITLDEYILPEDAEVGDA
ncbi:MAG: STAS domain-containing protein [Treponema sp.]|nr:STAS domain-containing protein [Treponema sp.]MBR4629738.1 STAS domain-containing protein [Treponema sp.]MBR6912560.1 STAS domain-containing protein [Treponema sp.]MCR5124069.1 STAS domain-containing protein [Treponema sp.]